VEDNKVKALEELYEAEREMVKSINELDGRVVWFLPPGLVESKVVIYLPDGRRVLTIEEYVNVVRKWKERRDGK